ncbi:MAG: glycerol kinase GlpK [Deltaproteobacteria bacterium]|nr:glycerol kinase GlpK [Deltaproteobacteria bacterium]
MPKYVLAVDQGTTGTTAMVVDAMGRIRGRAYGEIHQFYPRPGWVEHDPEEIYRSVVRQGRAALAAAHVKARELAAIGITNQRETFTVWERGSGRPLHRAIVWQCRRSAELCQRLREREPEITQRTGLLVDPYFSGTKLKWLLDKDRALSRRAARGEVCFGTIDSWLIFKLSRGEAFVTDFTNASRTMLMNLEQRRWDPVMLQMLGVPEQMLPQLMDSRGPLAEAARGTVTDYSVPIAAAIGDQQAALFGQGCVRPGDAKVTYGTGAFLLTYTGQHRPQSRSRLLATTALGAQGEPALALEGSIFMAGAVIQWLRDELRMISNSAESLTLARQSGDRTQPYVVPAFVGLGAPYWDSEARGAIVGITRGTTRADVVRAALDSIAFQVRDVIEAMEQDIGSRIVKLRVDGGATANDYLMQFQADLLGRPVTRPRIAETTALGAALLAGLATGIWRSTAQAAALRQIERVFKPAMKERERTRLIDGWRAAVRRVLTSQSGEPREADRSKSQA